jgi:hypothetical protein
VTEIRIEKQDIVDLGRTLDEAVGGDERALLASVIALAAKAIRSDAPSDPAAPEVVRASDAEAPVVIEVVGELPSLSKQIAETFIPGQIEEDVDVAKRVFIGHVVRLKVGE